MQQKSFEGSKPAWPDSVRNGNIYKPFRCPQCGENARFRSLSSLRAHLDFMHSYEERYFCGKSGIFCALNDNDLKASIGPLQETQIYATDNDLKPKSSSLSFHDLTNECRKISVPMEVSERPSPLPKNPYPPDSPGLHNSLSEFPANRTKLEQREKDMLDQIVETVDKTIEKRIEKLNKELCQKTSELLEVRAAFLQLSQKKQEVQRRERALSRQVDVAVELIAVLRQRLTESEQELQRKEEQVVSINHFLEAAAEKEFYGKRRLQHFIENLLQRVELAEKQLEYYQSRQIKNSQASVGDAIVGPVPANKKSKCQNRGSHHPVNVVPDAKAPSAQKGRSYINRVGIQPMKLLHESSDYPRDLWKPQKKGDPLVSARKLHSKSKLGKKSGPCSSVYKQY
ncbi:hypothetical protein XENTR_v10017919 [Xenopus tropicalis]|uniref:Protein ZNF365 n=1 Tax=Xenopus tropicalis TaxID=8364 RepID=A0A6I8R0X8_XENTR|nr:protein ZNF365 [Xenopus tropicalis]KAE8590055.1 hypothetical protein XENTR_v10017919 [Xenopus tropicalis]|eukprot:XP_002939589.1 PREDICTED: protein ZNF365 [Xenopus tropicalis]